MLNDHHGFQNSITIASVSADDQDSRAYGAQEITAPLESSSRLYSFPPTTDFS